VLVGATVVGVSVDGMGVFAGEMIVDVLVGGTGALVGAAVGTGDGVAVKAGVASGVNVGVGAAIVGLGTTIGVIVGVFWERNGEAMILQQPQEVNPKVNRIAPLRKRPWRR
jgi:hypothetical protein